MYLCGFKLLIFTNKQKTIPLKRNGFYKTYRNDD